MLREIAKKLSTKKKYKLAKTISEHYRGFKDIKDIEKEIHYKPTPNEIDEFYEEQGIDIIMKHEIELWNNLRHNYNTGTRYHNDCLLCAVGDDTLNACFFLFKWDLAVVTSYINKVLKLPVARYAVAPSYEQHMKHVVLEKLQEIPIEGDFTPQTVHQDLVQSLVLDIKLMQKNKETYKKEYVEKLNLLTQLLERNEIVSEQKQDVKNFLDRLEKRLLGDDHE